MNVSESTVPGLAEAPSPGETPLLSVRDLRIHFATKRGVVHAVDGINFDIHEGETLGLVGETGSGKSVTARSLLQLVPRPPGIFAGGHAMFHPKVTCPACSGAGCEKCGETGRVTAPCRSCSGNGCEKCEHSGQQTVDLLTASDPPDARDPRQSHRDDLPGSGQGAEPGTDHPRPGGRGARRTPVEQAAGRSRTRPRAREHPAASRWASSIDPGRKGSAALSATPQAAQAVTGRPRRAASPERWPRRASPIPARSCSGIRTSCPAA